MKALCIDPGTYKSGIVMFDGKTVFNINPSIENESLVNLLEIYKTDHWKEFPDILLIEMISSYGMPVGKETFETCVWIGRFVQAFSPSPVRLIYRKDVKLHLCNNPRAKDPNIRQAIVDRFEPSGGGKKPQFGTKKQPGPLYGVTSHAMSALALGVTFFETSNTGDEQT